MSSSEITSEAGWVREMHEAGIVDGGFEHFLDGTDSSATSWLTDVYRRLGALSREELRVVYVLEQISVAEAAVALVVSDIVRTTDLRPIALVDELDWGVRIKIFDGYTSPSMVAAPFRRAMAYAEVANYVQAQLVMASGNAGPIWPVCPEHGFGLHASVHHDVAVWICTPHDHVIARVGELQQLTPPITPAK